MKKIYVVGVIAVLFCIGVIGSVTMGRYPVLFVDGSPVWRERYVRFVSATLQYYTNAVRTYTDMQELSLGDRKEIQRAVLQGLVEEMLVRKELERRVEKELPEIIASKIKQVWEKRDLQEAVRMLYGLTSEEFELFLLQPKAEQEILEGRLYVEKVTFADWLDYARRNTRVIILVPGFSWNNGKVVAQ